MMENVFRNYAKTVVDTPVVGASQEADVNINIDVNEAGAAAAPVVETPPVVEPTPPAPESYSDPFEGEAIKPEVDEGIVATPPEAAVTNTFEETTPAAVTPEVDPEDTPPAEVALDEQIEEDEEKIENVEKAKASLESIYHTLQDIQSSGIAFDVNHANLARLAIAGAVAPLGATCAQIVPSLESDNQFEITDITASMESISSAIAAGAKAAYKAIKALLQKIKEWFKALPGKLNRIKTRFSTWKGAIQNNEEYAVKWAGKAKTPDEFVTALSKAFDYINKRLNQVNARVNNDGESARAENAPTSSERGDFLTFFAGVESGEAGSGTLSKYKGLKVRDYITKVEGIVNSLEKLNVDKTLEDVERRFLLQNVDSDESKDAESIEWMRTGISNIREAADTIAKAAASFTVDVKVTGKHGREGSFALQ